jgi:predicted transcriptional regulator
MGAAKEEARMLIEQMPDHATWDDIMYEFYVKKKLAKALDEAAAGEVVSHETAKEQLSSK